MSGQCAQGENRVFGGTREEKDGVGNPFARRLAANRRAAVECVSEEDVRAIMRAMVEKAGNGDTAAAKVVLQYAVGKPAAVGWPLIPLPSVPKWIETDRLCFAQAS